MRHYTINPHYQSNISFFYYNKAMKTHNVFTSQKFMTENLMTQTSPNWQYDTVYKLLPEALNGENYAIIFPSVQLSYGFRSGGLLYNIKAPKGMVSVALIAQCKGRSCFGSVKLEKGTLLIFDDRHANMLVTSNTFQAYIISISKKMHRKLASKLSKMNGMVIKNPDPLFAEKMYGILEAFKTDTKIHTDIDRHHHMENELLSIVEKIFQEQTPYIPKLTKGEKIALQIRDRIYKRITKKVTISSLAEEFGVSEQTLQNAFKSLFGLTPNKFLRNLKLNHVRKALIQASPDSNTIIRIANKWGFTHMGHFSRYYTDLFGENPSVTLQRTHNDEAAAST